MTIGTRRCLGRVEAVPAFDPERLLAEALVARRRPQLDRCVVVLGELGGGVAGDPLRRSGEQDRRPLLRFRRTRRPAVEPTHDAVGDRRIGRHRRHDVVLVVEREVVEDVAVLVRASPLRTSARARPARSRPPRRRTPGRRPGTPAPCWRAPTSGRPGAAGPRRAASYGRRWRRAGSRAPGVGGLPDQVADTLESEHRIERVERHHRDPARRVARGGGDEARHRAGFGDAFFEDLTLLRLAVAEQQVVVDRLVLLPLRGVDVELAEQGVHAERAGLVGDDRHDARPDRFVAAQVAQQAGEAHRGAHLLLAGARAHLLERLVARHRDRAARPRRPLRDRAVERLAALHHVLVLDRVLAGAEVRRVVGLDRRFGDLVVQVQPVTQGDELFLGHLLDLVRGVAALEAGAERPALDRLGEDHGRPAAAEVLGGGLVGGVQLAVVVAAAGEVAQFVVGDVRDDLAQAWVGTEEVVADVLAALDRVALELRRRGCCSSG